jgi:alkylation response protein AidB-like acyl-CoA dehydrogenase
MPSIEERLQPVVADAERYAVAVDAGARFPEETVAALTDSGLMGLTLPKEHGGLGAGPVAFADVVRQIASHCPSSAMVYLMHVCAAQVTLAGTADEGSDALHAMADGSNLSTLAFSERGSRSHFWAPVSQIADGRIEAQKSFVTSAGKANSYVVSTRPAAAESPIESSLYLVDAATPGVEVAGPWIGLGLRGNASAPMTIGIPASDATPVGEAGKGLDLMLGVVLPWFQLGQGAVSLGIAEGAMRAAIAHVTGAKLEHMGQVLSDLPTVRARLGRAQTEMDAIAGFLADLARRMEAGDAAAPVLSAKAAANEMAIRVTSEAMQACGGAAMSPALGVERFFRDARAGSVMAPTTDVLYELTGRALAGMPLM